MKHTLMDWPRFQSVSFVRAIFIGDILRNEHGALIYSENIDHEPVQVDHDFLGRFEVKKGGTLFQYDTGTLSYCPQDVFVAAHFPLAGSTSFGAALGALKAGFKVTRRGWNGSGLWLELQEPDTNSKMTLPYIYLNYPADAKINAGARVPWTPTQTDLLQLDWEVIF